MASIVDNVKSVAATVADAVTADAPQSTVEESGVVSPKSEGAKKLERKLSLRPEQSELVEKNILKSTSVAPGLQAKQADLARAQLEDKLENALQHRPSPDELVKEGILNQDEVPPK